MTLAFSAAIAITAADDASARGVRVDDGENFNALGTVFVTTPVNPPDAVAVDLTTYPNFATLFPPNDATDPVFPNSALGFSINYGQGQKTLVSLFPDGYISFGNPPPPSPLVPAPGVDGSGNILDGVAAPFYLTGTTPSAMSYAEGLQDFSGPPFAVADAQKTFRATWTVGDFQFQVVLTDASSLPGGAVGDFDMEFNYGSAFFDSTVPIDSLLTAGFHLGDWSVLLPPVVGTFSPANDYLFAFRGGVLTTTPPTNVSEPGTLALLGAGLIVIAGAALARRRRRAR
jgi:hypothetical protein